MIQLISIIKERLASGLLCCLILVAAYLFEVYFSHLYVGALSSSFYLSMWLTLFVGALLWTFRERNAQLLPSEVTDWQCIAAFLLITSQQIYTILPKELHQEMAPMLSTYTLPALIVGGIVVASLIKLLSSLYHLLDSERQQSALQTQRIQELLASPPSVQGDILLVRRLIENKSICRLSTEDDLLLLEGCRMIDPGFFGWLSKRKLQPTPREIVWCVLVRMRKTKEEMMLILSVSEGAYRTTKSRVRKHLCPENVDLETFLWEI